MQKDQFALYNNTRIFFLTGAEEKGLTKFSKVSKLGEGYFV